MSNVVVIGALGHVGFPFSLAIADQHHVVGVDVNEEAVKKFNDDLAPPFLEIGAVGILEELEHDGKVPVMTTDLGCLTEAETVVIMIGTPVDEEGNPRTDDIFKFFTKWHTDYPDSFRDKLIILRSTVSPGTTDVLIKKIENMTGLTEGKDFFLVFAPERVAQGQSIEETVKFPTLIGASSSDSFERASKFFRTFTPACTWLNVTEAELAKLMTNMWRYTTFAIANEYKMLADSYGCDVHKIIAAANYNYPRNNIPLPGPNVGGACLAKDGKFLTNNFLGIELIKSAYEINEGMPAYMLGRLGRMGIYPKKVMILGTAFKANSDDTRLSLSFKLKKLLDNRGVEVVMHDHLTAKVLPDMSDIDMVILMTPHTSKAALDTVGEICKKAKTGTYFVDFWHQHFEQDVVVI